MALFMTHMNGDYTGDVMTSDCSIHMMLYCGNH